MATYGEGDPTDNAQDFYDWLQENDDENLSGLNYTVSLRPRSVPERQKALGVVSQCQHFFCYGSDFYQAIKILP